MLLNNYQALALLSICHPLCKHCPHYQAQNNASSSEMAQMCKTLLMLNLSILHIRSAFELLTSAAITLTSTL